MYQNLNSTVESRDTHRHTDNSKVKMLIYWGVGYFKYGRSGFTAYELIY